MRDTLLKRIGGHFGDVERLNELEEVDGVEAVDARAAKVVELRFFGGLENEEIGEVLGISLATVKRDWALARAWLHRELGGGSRCYRSGRPAPGRTSR